MAILVGSNTQSEIEMKQLLDKMGLEYFEQYNVYEKAGDLYPKYVLDFFVRHGNKSVAIECDGFSFHHAPEMVDRDIRRDQWLVRHGYLIYHFTSYQIKYEQRVIRAQLENYFGIKKHTTAEMTFKGKTPHKTEKIYNVDEANLHTVELLFAYINHEGKTIITFRFNDLTKNVSSDEKKFVIDNSPEKEGSALALFTALVALKKSTNLTVFCQSSWMTAYFNKEIDYDKYYSDIIEQCKKLLLKHNYLFVYVPKPAERTFNEILTARQREIKQLNSRCMQVKNPSYINTVPHINFDEIVVT